MARVPNEKGSPHADKDIVIANGAIRSGKTIACICSFMRWSKKTIMEKISYLQEKQ